MAALFTLGQVCAAITLALSVVSAALVGVGVAARLRRAAAVAA